MEKKGAARHRVLELLEGEGGLSREAIRRVSEATGVPEADVYGTARFYDLLVRPGPRVCQGLTCKMAGADALATRIGGDVHRASCLGQCDRAPVAVGADMRITHAQARGGITADDPELAMNLGGEDVPVGAALARARGLGARRVIEELEESGLQGRGGAAFPAHLKWSSIRGQDAGIRYVVCNADEAEPATFKDRELMLRRPRLVVEGLAIAAETIGATAAYVYVRGEFPDEAASLEAAAREAGVEVRFVHGHGAYVCGEETAMLESIEGKRGMPRLKPPYPTVSGLFGKPTLIHNVETLACVPGIVARGGERFRGLGRTGAGTKLYCVSGHVRRPGVYELPLGVCLDELIEVAGGAVGEPAAFSPGGASSGFLPISERERPLDFEALQEAGSMLGSAGVVVLNDTVDLARAALWQAVFFEEESCGQCAPCRIGARVVRQALSRYLSSGDPSALEHLADVGWEMDQGSICGLGIAAPLPVLSAMRHFPDSFARRAAPGGPP